MESIGLLKIDYVKCWQQIVLLHNEGAAALCVKDLTDGGTSNFVFFIYPCVNNQRVAYLFTGEPSSVLNYKCFGEPPGSSKISIESYV